MQIEMQHANDRKCLPLHAFFQTNQHRSIAKFFLGYEVMFYVTYIEVAWPHALWRSRV